MALTGKVAVVTGASRGIGAAIAVALARQGADVACLATSAANAESTAAEVRACGGRSVAVGCRVEDGSEVDRAFEQIRTELGPPDVLVNNAGINSPKPMLEMTEHDWDWHMGVNAKSVFLCTQAAVRQMLSAGRRGSIINVGSIAGANAFPGRLAYCSSKAALHHATRVLAIELAEYGIRVNCVAPGYVMTEMVQNLADRQILDTERLRLRTPQRRLGTPEQIAATVAFLASEESDFTTGSVVMVDGGWDAYGFV